MRFSSPITASSSSPTIKTTPSSFRSKTPKEVNVSVVGSTGYIGKFVVKELVSRGFNVIAVAREKREIRGKNKKTLEQLKGANNCNLIVRPTAFFKSLAGQVDLVKDDKPYVMFGDRKLCAFKPISEQDLTVFYESYAYDGERVNKNSFDHQCAPSRTLFSQAISLGSRIKEKRRYSKS
ncbi:hypothetical protein GIB67_007491 [Kingdonia uniflora]|uniref:NmrA-like domain-containing protein n=1 Tax=Kingdonia uniflora TaxID=39325 RepID=A0A7J7LW06_9MAGN|nr:hypothetical protein GIB67_007491 [Kingdonia uniflora]